MPLVENIKRNKLVQLSFLLNVNKPPRIADYPSVTFHVTVVNL